MSDRDLDRLIALHLDDALDAASAQHLHEHLRSDADARRLLLSAATQAAVLPRVALESGLTHAPRAVPAPRRRLTWQRVGLATAAALMVGVGMWWSLAERSASDVHLVPGSGVVLLRDGQPLPAATAMQRGDRVQAGAAGTRLDWTAERTAIVLDAGTQVVIDELGRNKRLRLEHGTITADIAPQGDGGLSLVTPFGVVEVVGTRFQVQVDEHGSRVTVEHGAVRVRHVGDPTAVTVGAGFAVTLDAQQMSAPGPLAALPAATSTLAKTPATAAKPVRLGAATFRAEAGWEGDLVDDTIRARPVTGSAVRRITTPVFRPDGLARIDAALRCSIALEVDQATTLAVLLVCDHPDGGSRWLANVQAERRIPAGSQQVIFTWEDFHLTTAGPQPPSGSHIVAIAVMMWQPAADLRLRWIELGR
ncbi:MAG: FecR domain-containing protein [Planctomycetes bacterium]|nr:FecR domain-containing protein [Planctomycetota bacterium]